MKTRVIQDGPEPHANAAGAQQQAPTNSPEGSPMLGADENPEDVPAADIPDALEQGSNGGTQ